VLRPRVIPCLLLHKGGLVKTVQFSDPKYVGDPLNAVRIFNEKEVDELIVIDIDATVQGREPDYALIARLAAECRMPLCYSGGVKTPEQFERLVSLGVEKVAVSSAAIENPAMIAESARRVGSQSIVVMLDVKRNPANPRYELCTHNGKRQTQLQVSDFAIKAESLGAGELVLNSIDHDGTMRGYDFDLIDQVRGVVKIPISAVGGAGALTDIGSLIRRYGIIGAAAGSLFVFKGKFRAVLIQYPSRAEKEALLVEPPLKV
jgi:cyclase